MPFARRGVYVDGYGLVRAAAIGISMVLVRVLRLSMQRVRRDDGNRVSTLQWIDDPHDWSRASH